MPKDHTPPGFFVEEDAIKEDHVILTGDELKHALAQRLSLGEEFRAVTDGSLVHAQVLKVGKGMLVGSILWKGPKEKLPMTIRLAPCLLKGHKMDLVVEKATELGARSIHPLISKRTVPKLDFEKSYSKVKRWERVAKASAEQCARADLPAVSQIRALESFLEEDDAKGVKLFAYERRERCVPLDEVLSGNPQVTVIVGPEGGFEPSEVLSMIESGYLPVSIGPFITRAETAAISITAILAERLSSRLNL